MTEVDRIVDQMRRAFEGPAWHGDSIWEILSDVTAQQAAARPISNAHTIWELVRHQMGWIRVVQRHLEGKVETMPESEDFPEITDFSDAAWAKTMADFKDLCHKTRHMVSELDDRRLLDFAVGADYDLYVLLHGVIQHCIYHSGQIALLKKLI